MAVDGGQGTDQKTIQIVKKKGKVSALQEELQGDISCPTTVALWIDSVTMETALLAGLDNTSYIMSYLKV